jgi:hypothetical protein
METKKVVNQTAHEVRLWVDGRWRVYPSAARPTRLAKGPNGFGLLYEPKPKRDTIFIVSPEVAAYSRDRTDFTFVVKSEERDRFNVPAGHEIVKS